MLFNVLGIKELFQIGFFIHGALGAIILFVLFWIYPKIRFSVCIYFFIFTLYILYLELDNGIISLNKPGLIIPTHSIIALFLLVLSALLYQKQQKNIDHSSP